MSKSLKNFVTIRDALKRHTSRQLRLAFLLHSWKDTLDYSTNTMDIAVQYEKLLNEFFLNVQDLTRTKLCKTKNESFQKWTNNDQKVHEKFSSTKNAVHEALCDNVDTRTALDTIRELISGCNIYLRDKKTHGEEVNCILLRDIASYVTWLLKVFGAISKEEAIGFPVPNCPDSMSEEKCIEPYLILAEFRDTVRTHARQLKATEILKECDRLRDDILPNVGVRLEDREGQPSAVKLVDRETLLREREAKRQLEAEKAAEKERKQAEKLAAQAQKDAQRKIKPEDMFRSEANKYSKFDKKGLPTHDAEGKELSKGVMKKLQKLQLAQEKKHSEYLSSLQNGIDV